MKYVTSENATIQIKIADRSDYAFYCNLSNEFVEMNFQRVICDVLDVSFWDADGIKELTNAFSIRNCGVFYRIPYSYNFLKETSKNAVNVIAIIDVNKLDECQFTETNCFFEVQYKESDVEKIVDLLKEFSDRIILAPQADLTNLDVYKKMVIDLIERLSGLSLLFEPILIPKNHIYEHPCIVYLCSGGKCHNNHNNFPRHITIDENKKLYLFNYFNMIVGDLNETSFSEVIKSLRNNPMFIRLIAANKEMYLDMFDKYYLGLIPWFVYLKGYLHG